MSSRSQAEGAARDSRSPAHSAGLPKAGEAFNPKQILRWGFPENGLTDTSLSMGARLLFTVLWTFTNRESGKAWPTQRTLSKKLGVGRQTVNIYVQELVRSGYISVDKNRGSGRFASNSYRFVWREEYRDLVRRGGPQQDARTGAAVSARTVSATTVSAPTVSVSDDIELEDTSIVGRSNQRDTKHLRGSAISGMTESSPVDHRRQPEEPASTAPTTVQSTGRERRWTPTYDDAGKLLELFQELNGTGDIGFASECLSLVRRDAECVEDVLEVVRERCAGRGVRNNGYIRSIIQDRFGETVALRREREKELREKLKPRRQELRRRQSTFDEFEREAQALRKAGRIEEFNELMRKGPLKSGPQV